MYCGIVDISKLLPQHHGFMVLCVRYYCAHCSIYFTPAVLFVLKALEAIYGPNKVNTHEVMKC